MDEFIHDYEMESLSLGITARKDVIDQITSFFPKSESHIAGMLRTSQALAARREAKEQLANSKEGDDDDNGDESATTDDNASGDDARSRGYRLGLTGNSREGFRNRVRNIHIVALSNAVLKSKFAGIRVLDLSFNRLGEEQDDAADSSSSSSSDQQHAHDERKYLLDAAPSLGRMLQSTALYTSTIDELVLSGNCLGGESCRLLCASLNSSSSVLRKLNLRGNPLRVAGGHAIAELLASRVCKLEELDIGNTELEVENLIAISTALRTNTVLVTLNVDNPVIKTKEVDMRASVSSLPCSSASADSRYATQEEAIQHVGKMLQVNESLRSISLCKHRLTDDGAQVLAERLLDNHTLQCLALRANLIGATGASALAALVLEHDSLAQLDLSANRIGDAGADAFAQVLQRNTSHLSTLALCSTYLTDRGLAAIAAACLEPDRPDENHMQNLLLWGNDFGTESSRLFFQLCVDGGRFDELDVETDFVPRRTVDSDGTECVHIAHKDVVRATSFASPKR